MIKKFFSLPRELAILVYCFVFSFMATTNCYAAKDIASIFNKLAEQMKAVGKSFKIIMIVSGLIMMGIGLFTIPGARKRREPISGAIVMMVIGFLLSSIGVIVSILSETSDIENELSIIN